MNKIKAFILLFILSATIIFSVSIENAEATVQFSDGFESGDISVWTASYTTTGEALAISTSVKHAGTYALNCTSNGSSGAENAFVRNNTAQATTLYARAYVYVETSGIADDNDELCFLRFWNSAAGQTLSHVGLRQVSGGIRWLASCRDGTGWTADTNSTPAFSSAKWYCVEIKWVSDGSTGGVTLWVDGVQVCDTGSNEDTNNYGGVTSLHFGIAITANTAAAKVIIDTCAFGDSYIGPEVSDSDAPAYSAVTSSSTVSGSAFQFSCNVTDATAVDFVIPSTNVSGSWVNATALDASDSASYTANLTGTLPNIVDVVVSAKFYANDTLGNEGLSDQYNFTVTADSYTVTLSGLETANIGETVTISIDVSRSSGTNVSNWAINVTQNGGDFLTNYGESAFTFSEETATTHEFDCTGLYDADSGALVTPTCTPLSVAWQPSGGSSGASSNANDSDDNASPGPSPFQFTSFSPEDTSNLLVAVIVVCVGFVLALLFLSRTETLESRRKKFRSRKKEKSKLGRKKLGN